MSAPQFLLAVDGGGTNTQALIADAEGTVLARGLGPSSNLHNVGFEKGVLAIATAIEGALAQVRGTLPAAAAASGSGRWRSAGIAAACLGLSGVLLTTRTRRYRASALLAVSSAGGALVALALSGSGVAHATPGVVATAIPTPSAN